MIQNYKKKYINSFFISLYIFSSSICMPINVFTGSGFFIWFLITIVLGTSLIINKLIFNRKFIYLTILIGIVFLLNMTIYKFHSIIFDIFIEFIKFSLIPLYLLSTDFDFQKLKRILYKMGVLNFFIWILMIEYVIRSKIDYMFFGNYMLYSFIIFIYAYYEKKNILRFLLAVSSIILIFLIGNRASWIIGLIIWSYLFFKDNKKTTIKKLLHIFLILIIVLFLSQNFLFFLQGIQQILNEIGIQSYSINKLINAHNNGFITTVSGRDSLYSMGIKILLEGNLMPLGIGYYRFITGEVYPHNFILEYLITFGIIGILIFPVIILYFSMRYRKLNEEQKKISNILLIYVFIRLMMSTSFFIETILWFLIGLLIFLEKEGKGVIYEHTK